MCEDGTVGSCSDCCSCELQWRNNAGCAFMKNSLWDRDVPEGTGPRGGLGLESIVSQPLSCCTWSSWQSTYCVTQQINILNYNRNNYGRASVDSGGTKQRYCSVYSPCEYTTADHKYPHPQRTMQRWCCLDNLDIINTNIVFELYFLCYEGKFPLFSI